ncbi:polysaccharide deacetylase family protein [Bacillus sp. EB106-08-02-XG196]|jgi:peptidoglycan/xylan/chitin deacetylase (PgdA/CDA1 family)|uniref:polysaccharide deacetylase family protein n=1 Tax=Bacillus sp. EB106-08-02-XG196 TaxID=2737049 RepID=UPI0015C44FC8|nr:polysaccharide deacetylase family protein [Bacillus sp. EB106-08-02-XG196]NWQ41656.1 polysaccharide deacetylase family protein [Bacillus sp. EB106-08-02-XG196]
MTGIIMILTVLIFSFFLVLCVVSHVQKKSGKWIYFTLTALSLIAFVFMLFFFNWDLSKPGQNNPKPPVTEIPDKGNETPGIENPSEEKPPAENPTDEEPKDEEPAGEEDPKDENPKDEEPADPPPPAEPAKIIVPENGTVDYKVVAGDTLWSIAQRADLTVSKIKQWNNLTTDTIFVGQILKLYGKNVEPPPPQEPPKEETPPTTEPSVIISNGSLQQKEIALTFDAGSDAIGIAILDVLKKHNVKATFFLTGSWADKFPSYAKRMAAEGHDIGNHTYSHPDAANTNSNIFVQDIIKAEEAIKRATGVTPRPFFRFPFGSYNAAALKAVGGAGYPYSIQWTIDTIDWQQPSVEVIISRIQAGASNGDIILMHIGGINTPEAVDKVIPILKSMGYDLVTLTELLDL